MTPSADRLMVATDHPFWRRQDGPGQRIHSLLQFAHRQGKEILVFYLGPREPEDEVAVAKLPWEVEWASSDQPPEDWIPKIQWYLEATRQRWKPARPADSTNPPRPLTLADFRWPWAIQRFGETWRRWRPGFVLVEYLKLGYLLDGIPSAERSHCTCLVDTHDILSRRAEQFLAAGEPHWIAIAPDEEANTLQQFDVVIAIQPEEAHQFREWCPDQRVVVVGHARTPGQSRSALADPVVARDRKGGMRFGFLGSDNYPNRLALDRLLNAIWPPVRAACPQAELVVAGRVLVDDPPSSLPAGVTWLGPVSTVEAFYEQVDAIVNPVAMGTGLKIKNAEALCFGKPLLTSPEGWAGLGMPPERMPAVTGDDEWIATMCRWAEDDSGWEARCRQAVQFARESLSVEKVYSELARVLSGL